MARREHCRLAGSVNQFMNALNDAPIRMRQSWDSAQTFLRSIRARIILPYIILTVLVAFAGTYIVTTLVQGSLEDRLRSQVSDAAGVASDEVALFENLLLSQLRELIFLTGAYEAMGTGDYQTLQDLMLPTISNSSIRRTVVTDLDANVVLDAILPPGTAEPQPGGSLTGRDLSMVPLVQRALSGASDAVGDLYAGLIEIDDILYLAIGGPFRWSSNTDEEGGTSVGTVMVTEPLYNLLDQIKETAVVRRVTVFGPDGQVVATTLGEGVPQTGELAISPARFQAIISEPTRTFQEEREVLGRRVRFAYFPFLIRREVLGSLSVGIESGFVPETGAWGRLQLTAVFSLAMLAVIGLGLLISRRIIMPIMQLVRTSRAVAQGDLTQRTGIHSDDEIGALAETFDDMTETLGRRTGELERLLQDQREESSRVQAILSSIAEGVLLEDQNSRITVMNPAAQELLEVLSEQFTAMQPVREMDSASNVRRFEIGDRVISVETSPVVMPDGRQLGKVLVLRDITAETEVDRLKDDFIAQISHELRTPLTSIKGYSDLLLKAMGGPVGEQERIFLETINRHADSLEDMVADLLDFTQLEAGNLGLRMEPMSMVMVIQTVAKTWRGRFEEKGIQFSVRIEQPIPEMLGDESRLRRALDNLVENACNFTGEGGEASISLSANEHSVTVAVRDTGVGIAPEDQAHLFTRFYRVGLNRTVDTRGVGVDLYVAKAIIEGHGGEIWVESKLGKGSTFTFTVPLDAGTQGPEPPEGTITDLGDLLR
jgi:signal transduction histidine kinase/HAMP domain-containing protein